MTMTWLNRLLIALPLVTVAVVARAQQDTKRPAAPVAPAAAAPAAPAAPPAAPVARPIAPAAVPSAPAPAQPAALPPEATGPRTVSKPALSSGTLPPRPGVGTGAATKLSPTPAAAPSATVAAGGPPVAPPAAKPAPELDQLKFLMGKWRCEGRQFASPLSGPEHTFKAVAENKADLDGFWNQFTYEEKKSKEHRGFKVRGLWGWDQAGKHMVRAASSNQGNWDSATSPGLEGDNRLVWTGEFSGPMGRVPFRHTFTKKSDKEWSHALEVKDPSGNWTPTEDVSCKR